MYLYYSISLIYNKDFLTFKFGIQLTQLYTIVQGFVPHIYINYFTIYAARHVYMGMLCIIPLAHIESRTNTYIVVSSIVHEYI